MKHDHEIPAPDVGPETELELRRLANLFLLSSVTLVVLLLQVFAHALAVTFIPRPVYVVAGFVFLLGFAATYVYSIYVTYKARRWGWLAFCAIPLVGVPASVAYAWARRMEIEREAFGDQRGGSSRQGRRGGGRR